MLRIFCHFCSAILFLLATVQTLEFPPAKKALAVYEPWKASENAAINFHFRTYKSEALLMFQDSGSLENWLELKIAEGVILISLKTKIQTRVISFDHSVSDLRWHEVKLQWVKYGLIVEVDEILKRMEMQYIPYLKSDVYFGTVTPNAIGLKSYSRYEGCIGGIKYIEDGKQFEPRLLASSNTRPGCSNACADDKLAKCHNAGRCVDRIFTATCDCLGTGYEGYDCSKKSLVAWTNGTSYVIYDVARNPRSSLRNFIVFRFKTPDANSIILQTSMARDFLRIGLEEGNVKVAVSLGAGTLQVTAGNSRLNDDNWHSVKVSRVGREISLVVDDKFQAHDYTAGDFHRLDHGGESVIYIAGAPEHKNLPWRNFRGYLQQFIYDDLSILDKTFYTFDNRFITIGDMNIVF